MKMSATSFGISFSVLFTFLIPLLSWIFYALKWFAGSVDFFSARVWPILVVMEILAQVPPMINASYAHTERTTADIVTSILPMVSWSLTIATAHAHGLVQWGNSGNFFFWAFLGALGEIILLILLHRQLGAARQESEAK